MRESEREKGREREREEEEVRVLERGVGKRKTGVGKVGPRRRKMDLLGVNF